MTDLTDDERRELFGRVIRGFQAEAARLAADRDRLRAMLRECAAKLHVAAWAGGNCRAAVDAVARPFFDALGEPVPDWPGGPEHGECQCGRPLGGGG